METVPLPPSFPLALHSITMELVQKGKKHLWAPLGESQGK